MIGQDPKPTWESPNVAHPFRGSRKNNFMFEQQQAQSPVPEIRNKTAQSHTRG